MGGLGFIRGVYSRGVYSRGGFYSRLGYNRKKMVYSKNYGKNGPAPQGARGYNMRLLFDESKNTDIPYFFYLAPRHLPISTSLNCGAY